MIVFPNCKINIGLLITHKRADGFHNIISLFYPVPVKDALEIAWQNSNKPAPSIFLSGLPVEGAIADNLCLKAWHLLKSNYPQLPPVAVHLHKAIPLGAGLGGGSADAAFTLIALNEKYQLNLTREQLLSYALQLGSDCPFFIINKPCLAAGRGEVLQPVDVSLAGYWLVLVNPSIHISTPWAFSQLNRSFEVGDVADPDIFAALISQPVEDWKDKLVNDFEGPVFKKHPGIGQIKDTLYEKGAQFASMSGSGSTVYGLFKNAPPPFDFPKHYFLRTVFL